MPYSGRFHLPHPVHYLAHNQSHTIVPPLPTKIHPPTTEESELNMDKAHDTGFPEPFLGEHRNTTLPFYPPGTAPQEIDNAEELTNHGRKHKLIPKHHPHAHIPRKGRHKEGAGGAGEVAAEMEDGGLYDGMEERPNDDAEGPHKGGVKKVLRKLGCVKG